MATPVEWFVLITSFVIGLSHAFQPDAWRQVYAALVRAGRPGAFANGALSLLAGAVIAAGHPVWTRPGVLLTAFGWLLVAKGAVCFLAPDRALASMSIGGSGRGFRAGGAALLAVGAWSGYCLWARAGHP
jgi:uncharacterized protein YjeT (DUF2065 family)